MATTNIVRAIIGPRGGPVRTPDTNAGLVAGIRRQLGIGTDDRRWASKAATHLGVHPATVRRWNRGGTPTLNQGLKDKYLRGTLKPDRESRIRADGKTIVNATIEVSETEITQNCYLGNYARAVMKRHMENNMLDDHLSGKGPQAEFNAVFSKYLDEFGGTLVKINDIRFFPKKGMQ